MSVRKESSRRGRRYLRGEGDGPRIDNVSKLALVLETPCGVAVADERLSSTTREEEARDVAGDLVG